MNHESILVALAATLGATCALAQGTVNVPAVNDYFVTPPAVGAPLAGTPCPSATVPLSVAASPFTFNVSAATCPGAAGSPVFGLVNLAMPCVPGFVCLPPVAGCYGVIPPVGACLVAGAVATNQSLDLTPGSFFLFSGVMGPFGMFTSTPVALIPAFIGVPGSTQAFFFDFTVGLVATEAWDFIIVP